MMMKYLAVAVFAAFLIGACATQQPPAAQDDTAESAARAEEAARRAEEAANKAAMAAEKSEVIFNKGLQK